MSWSDAFTRAQSHELLSNLSDHEPKTAVAYVSLKTHLAMRGPAGLWADERHLASMARCTRSWWRNRAWPALMHLFVVRDDRLFAAEDQGGDVDAQVAATMKLLKPTSVAASHAATTRWERERAAKEAARQAAEAASQTVPPETSDPHGSGMRSASDSHMRMDAAIVGNQDLGHTENYAENMRGASDAHEGAVPGAHAHAPALSLSPDSVLPDSGNQPVSKEESEGERERARATAHDAQACGSGAPGHASADAPEPEWKKKRRLEKAARASINVPLPDDWQPGSESTALAKEKGHDVDVLAAHFRDHYRGNGARKANWEGMFCKWIRNEPLFDPDKLKQSHLAMPIAGGAAGQPKVASAPDAEDVALKARVAAAEAWAGPALAAQWARVRAQVRVRIGPVAYRTWLADMTLAALDGDELVVHLPNAFARDHVAKEYAGHLTQLWRAERSDIRRVELRAAPLKPAHAESSGADESDYAAAQAF